MTRRRPPAALLLSALFLSSSPCYAIDRRLPPKLYTLVDAAASAPPEFAADTLLRVAESGAVADRLTRQDLIVQAFSLSANAHARISRRAVKGAGVDTEGGMLDLAYRLNLDRLSLQTRALRLLIPLDKKKARELFLEIPPPEIPALTCEDALVYDPSVFYEVLGEIASQTFSPEERRREDHVSFLLGYLSGVTSPSELAPYASMVHAVSGLTPNQRESIETRINTVLASLAPDGRAFLAVEGQLRQTLPADPVDKYAERSRKAAFCGVPDPLAPKVVILDALDTKPVLPKTEPFWQSPGSKDVLAAGRQVRFSSASDAMSIATESERKTPEWQDRFFALLDRLTGWQPDPGEQDTVFYHEKAILYQGLADVSPPGRARDRLLDDFARFVGQSNLQRENALEWFSPVPGIITRFNFADAADRAEALQRFAKAGNPVLTLYAALEQVLPSNPAFR